MCIQIRGYYDQAILLSDILDLFCDQKLVNTFGYLTVINLSVIFNNNSNEFYICYQLLLDNCVITFLKGRLSPTDA